MGVTVEEVHDLISQRAAEIGNAMANRMIPELMGSPIFRNHSSYAEGKISLLVEPGWEQSIWMPRLRQIALAATKQAVIQYKDLWAGLIIGEARQGRNYFDFFK